MTTLCMIALLAYRRALVLLVTAAVVGSPLSQVYFIVALYLIALRDSP